MASSMIDLDRGVTIRTHPNGMRVHMYKDDPGLYLDVYGEPVQDSLAAEAGFDVKSDSKERKRKERMEEARRRIDEELKEALEEAEDEYYTKHAGRGRYHVIGPEGQMTEIAVDKDEAERLVEEYSNGTSASSRQQPLEQEVAPH